MKIDLITVQPKWVDYPLFRKLIKENRGLFNKVIIVFTDQTGEKDISNEVMEKMKHDDVSFMISPQLQSGEDWRHVATTLALNLSDSDWILFFEQDMFPKEGFWERLFAGMVQYDVVTIATGDRLHPACFAIKREILDKTCKNFAPDYVSVDHFGMIQRDLETKLKGTKILILPEYLYYHMNGLTNNLWLKEHNETPNYKPEEFEDYLIKCKENDN